VKSTRTLTTLMTAATIGVLTLAGCSSGSGNASTAADGSSTTVTIRDTGGGQVLATPDGRTLYVSDQEKGKVLCASSACEAIWAPLTLPSGARVTPPSGLKADLGTVHRPDGGAQVTFDGRPLYTFSLDRAGGQTNGDGASDSFDGIDFTWHAAAPAGAAPATKSPDSDDGGYGY